MLNYSDLLKLGTDGKILNFTTQPFSVPVNPLTQSYTLSYTFLTPATILTVSAETSTNTLANYYSAPALSNFVTHQNGDVPSATLLALRTIMKDSLNSDPYSVYFGDVAKVQFSIDTSANPTADIAIGMMDNEIGSPAYPGIPQSDRPSATFNNLLHLAGVYGDIWLNAGPAGNPTTYWDSALPGSPQFVELLHEVALSLGLHEPPANIYTLQQTIMNTIESPANGMSNPNGTPLFLSGLQIADILAIQSIYGANYSIRSGDTVYGMGHGFGATPSTQFVYTIWDGGGTNIIDASSYGGSATINLNQGAFSSIGPAAADFNGGNGLGHAVNNVAIAFGSVIQNAIGTQGATTFVGNLWNNVMAGTGGFNTFYTDQLLTDNGTAGIDWVGDAIAGKPSIKDPLKWASDPNYHAPPILKNDVLIGDGNGNTFFSGKGNNIIEGGYNLAEINSAANALVSGWGTPTAQNYWDSAHQFTPDSNGVTHNVSGTPLADVAPANALSNTADYSRLAKEDTSIVQGHPGIDVTFSNATSTIVVQKGAIDNISGKGIDGTDNLLNIQNIVGSAGDDSISGTSNSAFRPFTFFGSTGNDTYNGGGRSNALDYSTLSLFDKSLNPDSTGITFNSNGSGGFVIDKGAGNVDGTDTVNGSFHTFTGSVGKDTFNISTSGTFAGGDGVDTFNVTGGAVVNIVGDQMSSAGEEYSNTLNLTLGGGIAIDGNSYSSSQILGGYSSIDNLVVAGSNNTYSEQFFKPDGFVRVQLGGNSDTGNAVKNIAFAETLTPGVLLTAGGAEVHGWQSMSNIGALAVKSLGYTYDFNKTMDYSGYSNFSGSTGLRITTAPGNVMTVADGTKADTINSANVDHWFAGSNRGDTYDLSIFSSTPSIWMGSGDNVVNGFRDAGYRIVYTGGHDTFNGLFDAQSPGANAGRNSVILGPGILSPAIKPDQISISVQNVHDGLLDMVLTTGSGSLTFTKLNGTLNPDHTISFPSGSSFNLAPRIEFWNDNFRAISSSGFFPAKIIQHFHTGVVQASDLGTATEFNFPNGLPPAPTLTVPGNTPIASGNHIVHGLGAPGEILNGGASDVTLISGNANDYINAQFGNDIIWGGSVSDEIHAGWGNSVIHAGSGGETIYCEYGNQTVYGGSGMDTIIGGRGDDTIFAGTGTNVIWGYQGHNTFVLNATGNTTIMDYKPATDTLDYAALKIKPEIVHTSRTGTDLVLSVPNDPVTIHGFFANNTGQNQTIDIQFASLGPSGSATYTVDSTGHTVSLVIHGANQPPVAQPDNFSINENAPLTGNVLADNGHGPDTDPNGLALSVVAGTFATAHGGTEVMAANGSFTYTPAAEFHGADSFTYTLQDTAGGTATGTVSIAIAADAPVAQNGQFIMSENGVLTGNVLANNGFGAASDPDGDIAGVQAASLTTAHGATAVINADGSFTYTPVAGYNGPDSFNYTVLDSQGASASAQINIGITPDAPTAQNETLTFPWGQPVTGNLMEDNGSGPASDPDHDVLHVSSASAMTANGFAVSFAPDGSFSVAAPNWFVGQDTFSYTVSDPFGQTSTAVATVNIIPPANSLVGTSGNDVLHGTADGQFIFSLQGNDTIFAGPGHETIYAGPGTDVIYGGTGPDTMIGSTGTYSYFVNNEHDVVIQNPAGHGTVFTSVDFTVPDNITAMTLTGHEELTATANNLNDIITTNSAEDTLIGGKGTDTFIIHNSEDHINTKAGGTYDVISDVSYELPEGVRSLTLTGNKHLTGVGNDMNNVITANNAGDRIIAGDGNNTIFGGTGNDSISCGDGNNVINGGGGNDRVELGGGSNTVVFKAATAFTGIVTVENFKTNEGDGGHHGHQDQHGHDDNHGHDHGQNGQNPIDHLDISNLLTAFDPLTEALSQFVHVTQRGHNTVVSVDAQGPAAPNAFVQVATLEHVTGLDLNTMIANGTLIVHS